MVIDLPIDRAVCQHTPRRPGTFERSIHRLANSLPKQREKTPASEHEHPLFSVLSLTTRHPASEHPVCRRGLKRCDLAGARLFPATVYIHPQRAGTPRRQRRNPGASILAAAETRRAQNNTTCVTSPCRRRSSPHPSFCSPPSFRRPGRRKRRVSDRSRVLDRIIKEVTSLDLLVP
jgi:hypothetical protein